MTKAELEKKRLADLHALAAEAGVERYRMLSRAELIEQLAGGSGNGSPAGAGGSEPGARPARRRRSRGGSGRRPAAEREGGGGREEREPTKREPREPAAAEPRDETSSDSRAEAAPEPAASGSDAAESSGRPRRRRRRRFGRRGKQGVTLPGLLLPPESRQALLAADSREACTALLRGIAADLSEESNGPDPVALLVDPSPEELGDWRRDAPQAEIVAAGQPRHADDALAQAVTRASGGEDVILLVDSLTRLGEAYGDADAAKQFFDAGRKVGGSGSLTVVAALERQA